MRLTLILIVVLTTAAEEFSVTVYEGPPECVEDDRVKVGDQLAIHYSGSIAESSKTGEPGKQFDSSRTREALAVDIGFGQYIRGWDEGLIGLCKGAKAILIIPPEMGYGDRGAGGGIIPGGATLNFDVEVVSVSPFPGQPNLFDDLDVDEDGLLTPEEILAHFRQADATAELPPNLLDQEDTNGDGVVSRDEFGGPRMEWPMCMEMLFRNKEPTTLGLAVRWACQRDREHANDHQAEGEDLGAGGLSGRKDEL